MLVIVSLKRVGMRLARTFLWPIIIALTIAALALLNLALGHWWPSGNAWYLPAAVSVVVLVITGVTWLFCSIYEMTKYRRRAWWMAIWPLVTVLGVTVAFISRPDFEDARPQFKEIAQ